MHNAKTYSLYISEDINKITFLCLNLNSKAKACKIRYFLLLYLCQ